MRRGSTSTELAMSAGFPMLPGLPNRPTPAALALLPSTPVWFGFLTPTLKGNHLHFPQILPSQTCFANEDRKNVQEHRAKEIRGTAAKPNELRRDNSDLFSRGDECNPVHLDVSVGI